MDRMKPNGEAVSAVHVEEAVAAAVACLQDSGDADWTARAGSLRWDCRFTAEHLASELTAYAGQLVSRAVKGYVPFDIVIDKDSDLEELLGVLTVTGGLLASVVRTAPDGATAWHPAGTADAEAFAAMGVAETLLHTQDLAEGLGLTWDPPRDLCALVLGRLFPDAPGSDAAEGDDPWTVLLWATGRGELEGHARLTRWRWFNEMPSLV